MQHQTVMEVLSDPLDAGAAALPARRATRYNGVDGATGGSGGLRLERIDLHRPHRVQAPKVEHSSAAPRWR